MHIKELRVENNLTQQAVSDMLGITRGAYANIEIGRREPDISTLIRLADFYNVTLDYLVGHEKKPTAKDDGLETYEKNLLAAYRMAAPDDRAIIDNIVRRYTHAQTTAEKHA